MTEEKSLKEIDDKIEKEFPKYYVCYTVWDFARPYTLNYMYAIVSEHPLVWCMRESKATRRQVCPLFYDSVDESIAKDFIGHITDNNLLNEIEIERLTELQKRKEALKTALDQVKP